MRPVACGLWPVATAHAYEQASGVPGRRALEISVCLSSDGVLVGSHDPPAARATGVDYTIAQQTWDYAVDLARVSAAETTDPAQPARPLTRFDEVVDAYINDFVLFVEPEVGPARGLAAQPVGGSGPARARGVEAAVVAAARAAGKATISWAIRNLTDPDRVLGLGCRAPMTANVTEILGPPR